MRIAHTEALSRLEKPVAPRAERSAMVSAAALVGMAAIWAFALFYFRDASLNHDTAWYLSATRRWLFDDAVLYRDIVELNPPLAVYLTAPPLLAAEALGIAETLAFNIYVLLVAALSTALVLRVVSGASAAGPALAGTYAAVALVVAAFGALPDQGQREHFAVLFALPFVTLAAFRPLGVRTPLPGRIGIAAFACLGLLLKPHFLLAPAAMSAAICWRERSWRPLFTPENWTIGALAVAYLLAIVAFHPAYIEEIVPLARATYGAYYLPLPAKLPYFVVAAVCAAAFVALLSRAPRFRYQCTGEILFAAALGFLVAYIVQDKGFGYHRIPANAFGALAAAVFIVGQLEARLSPAALRRSCVAIVFLSAGWFLAAGQYRTDIDAEMHREIGAEIAGQKVAGFSFFLQPFFPFVTEANAEWVFRYPALWPLRAVLEQTEPADPATRQEARGIVEKLAANVAADLVHQSPDFVIIDRRFGRNGLDYVGLFSTNPDFTRAWRHYRLVKSFGGIELWERDPTSAGLRSAGPLTEF
jgi:hypothetical protein